MYVLSTIKTNYF